MWLVGAAFCLTAFLTDMHLNADCSQVAHPDIRDQLVSYIYNGFLVPVLAPALHKVGLLSSLCNASYGQIHSTFQSADSNELLNHFLSNLAY